MLTTAARFDVLIHAPFYGALRALAPDVRARFRRLVDRLRAGHWSGGTRVKKLRGCAKPVFEARQDAGTGSCSPSPTPPRGTGRGRSGPTSCSGTSSTTTECRGARIG